MYDYLFELTEYSENEGEQILYEGYSEEEAWNALINDYGFKREELCFLECIECWEGEMLGLDTY